MVTQSDMSKEAALQTLPRWLGRSLSVAQVKKIEQVIFQAEAATSGEIVVVLTARTFPLRSLEILFGFICAFLGVVLVEPYLGDWLSYGDLALLALAVVAVWVGGNYLARVSWMRRILLNDRDSGNLAHQRAELEFHRAGIGRTENKTGILLFLALQDREAVVLADKGISSKIQPEAWSEVISLMLSGIKNNDLASGLSSAVSRCGEILATHFPINSGDRNELSNHLIIKD